MSLPYCIFKLLPNFHLVWFQRSEWFLVQRAGQYLDVLAVQQQAEHLAASGNRRQQDVESLRKIVRVVDVPNYVHELRQCERYQQQSHENRVYVVRCAFARRGPGDRPPASYRREDFQRKLQDLHFFSFFFLPLSLCFPATPSNVSDV